MLPQQQGTARLLPGSACLAVVQRIPFHVPTAARVAELADALASGASGGNPVEVRILSRALMGSWFAASPFFVPLFMAWFSGDGMRLFEGTQFDRPPRCERCEELEADCKCEPEPEPRTPVEKQTAKLSRQKRKRGKVVSIIEGLLDEGDALQELLTKLKTACGAGGTIKDGVLEIQGEHLERVRDELKKIGYRVKG